MGSGSDETAEDADSRGSPESDEDARVLLFMRSGRDRELLAEVLSDQYEIETTTDVETLESAYPFDCCVFDARAFNRVAGIIQPRRELSAPVFLPFVLLVGDESSASAVGNAWDYVDDVIQLPVQKAALRSRITNLVTRRKTSIRLAEREQKLAETVTDLQLKERAMDEAPIGITLAKPGQDENPLIYVNDGFEALTGYGSAMLGADCRFLQGDETDPETTAAIREAINDEEPIATDILNYRANGQKFWNRLTIAPIHDETDRVTHYVGFQIDITERKIRERRLEVMGRVLNHNPRNKMNLIEGYTELLRREVDDESVSQKPLEVISETTDDLMRIAEAVRKIDHTLSESPMDSAVDLRDRLSALVNLMRDRYPAATFTLSLPAADTSLDTTVVGLMTAIEEGVENAVKHNDAPNPTVTIRVERPSAGWIAVEIEDDGPGIPDTEIRVLERGESSLTHAERLGIWLMYWVVSKSGGDFSVSTSDAGTTLRMSVPAHP